MLLGNSFTTYGMSLMSKEINATEPKIDTGSASGKLRFHVFAALAEFKRNLIRERILAGLTAARARGQVCVVQPLKANVSFF